MNYQWRMESSQIHHFFRVDDGKILGTVWQYVTNHTVWVSKIIEDDFPLTDNSEKHIGRYISQEHAQRSVEHYWNVQDRTLIAQ